MSHPRPQPPSARAVHAAGAIVWRPASGGGSGPTDIEVLVVHRPKYNDWSWPKGKQEPGEHILACATREVEEETGLPVVLGTPLTTQRYKLGRQTTKEVRYWVATPDIHSAALAARAPVKRASEREIDEARWVKPARALKLLTRRGDRRLLTEVTARAEAGTLVTRAFMLLRHAKSVKRSEWKGGTEVQRSLAREGVKQVGGLTAILSAYGVGALATSTWRRCVATVGPYATLTGAGLTTCPTLTEEAAAADPRATRATFRDLITASTQPTAVCVHRPTIPMAVGELAVLTPNALSRQLPQTDPYLSTAEALVVHVGADGTVVALERARP